MHTAWVAPRYPVPITVIRGRGGASVLSFMEPSMGADDAVPDTARPRWLAGVGVTGPDRAGRSGVPENGDGGRAISDLVHAAGATDGDREGPGRFGHRVRLDGDRHRYRRLPGRDREVQVGDRDVVAVGGGRGAVRGAHGERDRLPGRRLQEHGDDRLLIVGGA